MRVITSKVITDAMRKHPQWKVGLKLWLDVFNNKKIKFESFGQLRILWRQVSCWNVDRIPARSLRGGAQKGPLDVYVFDIHKNDCRLLAWLSPRRHILYLTGVYSHAEYDKWWKSYVK